MSATTAAALRDQMITAVEAVVPLVMSGDRFRVGEQLIDFADWAEANPGAAFRRFGISFDTADQPLVSNTDLELRRVTFVVFVAYPHDARYGDGNTRSRDDVMERDQHQIEGAIGLRGFLSFTDAAWVDTSQTPAIHDDSCDFLVFNVTLEFWRAFP